ncbi:hypothetical protein LXA43DRAFT_976619 [Ganoderma leucocontextum]|nr:hypothetical protein LXA43DRAFT_976619 [Ganoderma leucocontextum]
MPGPRGNAPMKGDVTRMVDQVREEQVYRTITQRRIGILLIQEAHLTEEHIETLHKMYGRKMKIIFSSHTTQPTQKEGVAVVINPQLVNIKDVTASMIVPGRAIQECRLFFHELREFYETKPGFLRPNLMTGNFNTVEEPIDRLPAHAPADPLLSALEELKDTLHFMIVDGWRLTNPTKCNYTFQRGIGPDAIHSRLDRIYVTEEIFEWCIEQSGVKTDQAMVSVDVWAPGTPDTGRGRPVFPIQLLHSHALTKQMKKRGLEAIAELTELTERGVRAETKNPQVILYKLKGDWMRMARDLEKRTVPIQLAEIQECELKRRLEGEWPTKYWMGLHKPATTCEVIAALEKNPDWAEGEEPCYETNTEKLAELARRHHGRIQKDGPDVKPEEACAEDIKTALDSIEVKLTDDEAETVGGDIEREECELSLWFSKSGSAPGLDGIPYEVWKTLHEHYKDSRHEGPESMDVMLLLHSVFWDIEVHGMAPIYKEKGE